MVTVPDSHSDIAQTSCIISSWAKPKNMPVTVMSASSRNLELEQDWSHHHSQNFYSFKAPLDC